MDRTKWQKKHYEECYLPAAKAYLEESLDYTRIHAADIHKELTGQLNHFLQSLCLLQEERKIAAVERISISFLYTSLICGKPSFLFEVYPSLPFLEEATVAKEFQVSWLFRDWEEFLEGIRQETGKRGMNTVIRMPYIRSRAMGTARIVVRLMTVLVKYHFYDIEQLEAYGKLKKAENFALSFGEYYDWQQPLLEKKQETDIFQCEKEANLRFCRFEGKWYENKVFEGLNLDDCRFINCTFVDSVFKRTSFRDARFLGCRFTNCELIDLGLQGARFDGCIFEGAELKEIETRSSIPETREVNGFWGMSEFIGCSFCEVRLISSDFSAGLFRDCRIKEVETQGSILPDSFTCNRREGEEIEVF